MWVVDRHDRIMSMLSGLQSTSTHPIVYTWNSLKAYVIFTSIDYPQLHLLYVLEGELWIKFPDREWKLSLKNR